MLRSSSRSVHPFIHNSASVHHQKWQRQISGSCTHCSKGSFNANRQGKIMSKLFGERLSGSKKRWYPMETTTQSQPGRGALILNPSQLSKPGGAGKNTLRRSAVLNKLFMEQISSLLATGSIADCFLGRGLQLTRVKISPDFSSINVYWLGRGDPLSDGKLSDDLSLYSGPIRHELSQLRVMGEVPRINFVQDRKFANMEHVETLLNKLDLSQESDCESEEEKKSAAERMKGDFYGDRELLEKNLETVQAENFPTMRHDVFGLDHRGIMSKILTKMKKTRQAWETHSERQEATSLEPSTENSENPTVIKNVERQIEEMNSTDSEGLKKFLAQRRDRKNTPERKKYRKEDDISLIDSFHDSAEDVIASKHNKDITEDDYLPEDFERERKL